MPEIIGHGEHGLLFAPGDAAELSEHLRWLANNPVRAGEMGMAGRRRVEERYSWAAYYSQLRDVYRQVGVAAP
jgi:glycosyltransferase involved in cell wall biosynthesis